MRKLLYIVLITLTFTSVAIGQTKDSTKTSRCNQYGQILKFISDTTNLKFYRHFVTDIKEIKPNYYYRHFAMRNYVKYSFKHYLKDSPELYKSVSVEKNNLMDSLVYSYDLKDNTCINFNSNTNTEPNLNVLFDRYDENIVFVKTRFIREGHSFGSTYIFWFDKSLKYTYKEMGYVE